MTIDKALETLFAMANVQDGYAKKATDPGLKIIHKANARAQREVAAAITDLREEWNGLMRAAHDNHEANNRAEKAEAERDAALAWVGKLREAGLGLKSIVEGIQGAVEHGTWRAERSNLRMKDTDEWVTFYNVLAALDEDARHG